MGFLHFSEKTKGQLKDKGVSALFHTFWHFSTHFHTFSEFFLQSLFLELRGFTTVLVKRDEKRIKENKEKKTKPFCMLVVARLSSSEFLGDIAARSFSDQSLSNPLTGHEGRVCPSFRVKRVCSSRDSRKFLSVAAWPPLQIATVKKTKIMQSLGGEILLERCR